MSQSCPGLAVLTQNSKSPASVAFPAPQPYRPRHGHASVRLRFTALVSGSQSRLAGTRTRRPATSVDRPAPATPWPASALRRRPPALGLALPDLAEGPRRHGAGQTGDSDRLASQRLPPLLAAAL